MLGDADLFDPGQRHDAATGARQIALVSRVEQEPDVAIAAALVEGLQPLLERGGAVDAATFALTAARRELTAASSSVRRARVSSSCRSAARVVFDCWASWSASRCSALMRSLARCIIAPRLVSPTGGGAGTWARAGSTRVATRAAATSSERRVG
jgi:hypothetical protein